MKQIITIILFCFATIIASSQQMQFDWITQAGGPGWDVVSDIAELPDGNLAVAGAFYESINFQNDTLFSEGSRDVFMAVYTPGGSIQKLTSLGGYGFEYVKLIEATQDGVILPLYFNNYTEVAGRKIESNFSNNILITWLDAGFNPAQSFLLSSTKEFDITGIKSLPDGNCIFSGWFSDTLQLGEMQYISDDAKDAFVGKLSSKGQLEWFRHLPGKGNDKVAALCATAEQVSYLFCGTSDSGCFTEVKAPGEKGKKEEFVFLAEMDSTGTAVKVEYLLSGNDIQVKDLIADSSSVWILLNHKRKLDLNKGEHLTSQGKTEAVVISLNRDDRTMKYLQFGGKGNTEANRMIFSGKDILVTGNYSGKMDQNTKTIKSGERGSDIFIAGITADCLPLDYLILGGERNEFPCSAFASNSGIYLTGEFKGKLEIPGAELQSTGKEDIFLARIENCSAGNPLLIEFNMLSGKQEEPLWELDAGDAFVKYSWNDGLSDSRYLVCNKPGTYSVSVSDFLGCVYSDTIELIAEKSARIEANETTSEFKIYPSVTSGNVYWEPASKWENLQAKVEVFDVSGRKISSHELDAIKPQVYSLSFEGETDGSYLVEISGLGFREVSRITVKK